MPRHLAILFFFTFLLGLFAGFLVFLHTQQSNESSDTPSSQTYDPKSFEVIGYTHGGCQNTGCTSYRLQDDGTYTYILLGQNGTDQRSSDELSNKQLTELTHLIEETDFASIASSTFSGTCPTTYNANAYRYEIRVGDNRYSFDSCNELLDGEPLFDTLGNYFEVFSALYRNT